jgi:RNA polymerase sigma-70 factor, ECF subfamily
MQTDMQITSKEPVRMERKDLIGVYEQYSHPLYRYSVRMLGDEDLAEECVAETFSRFLQAVKNGGGPKENVQAYLYRVAHNWITDFYRRSPQMEALDPGIPDTYDSPLALMAKKQERERVRKALLRLTSEQRQVIQLHFFEDWSYHEIAEAMGKTAEAIRALQHRALTALKGLLIEQEDKNQDG